MTSMYFPARCCVAILFVTAHVHAARSAAVGIDFGFENMRVAEVQDKGASADVVLNERGERRTPAVFTFHDQAVLVGSDAVAVRRRYPSRVLGGVQQVLGRPWADPRVQSLRKQHAFDLTEDPLRHTSNYVITATNYALTPEEVAAVLLRHQAELAAKINGSFTPVVISVPPFMTHSERLAILDAADLVDLPVASIVNDNVAVAIHYGLSRSFTETPEKPRRVLFYDMGAGSTKVSLVNYSTDKAKVQRGVFKSRNVRRMDVRAVTYDDALGGYQFDLRMAALLTEQARAQANSTFVAGAGAVDQYGTASSPVNDAQVWTRVLEQAKKAKEVLSANSVVSLVVDALSAEKEFRTSITREAYLARCTDLLARAVAPLDQLLRNAGLRAQDVDEVVMVGGGTRMPKIQELLREYFARPNLEHTINAEEAAALGTAYLAATLDVAQMAYDLTDVTPYNFPINVLRAPRAADGIHLESHFVSASGFFAPFNATVPRARLASMLAVDARTRRRAAARNELETFIYTARDALQTSRDDPDDALRECCDGDREAALQTLETAQEWLENEPSETDGGSVRNTEQYQRRLAQLRDAVTPLLRRMPEVP